MIIQKVHTIPPDSHQGSVNLDLYLSVKFLTVTDQQRVGGGGSYMVLYACYFSQTSLLIVKDQGVLEIEGYQSFCFKQI